MPKSNSDNRSKWKQLIQEQEKSGLSVPKFCLEKNLKNHQFTYYKSILFPQKIKKSSFTELTPKVETAILEEFRIVIYYNDLSIVFEGHHDLQKVSFFCQLLDQSK
jgi:hypothetical protein